jgi:hypothetical protein
MGERIGVPVVQFDREMKQGKEYAYAMEGKVLMGMSIGRMVACKPEAAKKIMTDCCKYVAPATAEN